MAGSQVVERFRQIVPLQTDVIELPEIGHFPHFEAPEKVLDLFFEFHEKNQDCL